MTTTATVAAAAADAASAAAAADLPLEIYSWLAAFTVIFIGVKQRDNSSIIFCYDFECVSRGISRSIPLYVYLSVFFFSTLALSLSLPFSASLSDSSCLSLCFSCLLADSTSLYQSFSLLLSLYIAVSFYFSLTFSLILFFTP